MRQSMKKRIQTTAIRMPTVIPAIAPGLTPLDEPPGGGVLEDCVGNVVLNGTSFSAASCKFFSDRYIY